jgi:hypothetical protein
MAVYLRHRNAYRNRRLPVWKPAWEAIPWPFPYREDKCFGLAHVPKAAETQPDQRGRLPAGQPQLLLPFFTTPESGAIHV